MKKNSIKLLDSERSLPSIKKHRTTMNSPRTIFNNSPVVGMGNSSSPKSKDLFGNQRSQDKLPNFEEVFKRKGRRLTTKTSNISLSQKINNLFKKIAEQDNYIRTLETEFNVSKSDFAMKALKGFNSQNTNSELKSELDSMLGNRERLEELDEPFEVDEEEEEDSSLVGFFKDEGTSNKYKDLEIYKLRKKIDDDNNHLSKLAHENMDCRKKYSEYDENVQKIGKFEKEISDIKAETKQEVKKIQHEIYERENELASKMADVQELADLLKRSEEKRNYSNEYNIFMESNSAKLKDRISALTLEKAKIAKEIEEVQKKILDKENFIDETQKKLLETQESIENEKVKNNALTFNYEAAKEGLKLSTEKYEMEKVKFQAEKEKLQTEMDEKTKESESSSGRKGKRNSTLNDKSALSDLCKEEAVKWQQKYTAIDTDLNQAKEEVVKLKKNEIYLQNKLLAKDLMIAQIESLLKETEEKAEIKAQESAPATPVHVVSAPNPADLTEVITGMKDRYKSSKNAVKCVSCKKIPVECYLAVPCGHLSCALCKSKSEVACAKCLKPVIGAVRSPHLDRIVYNFKKETEIISRATKLLGVPNLK